MIRVHHFRRVAMAGVACLVLAACDTPRRDAEADTEPAEGRSDGPGLFTGKNGGLVFEKEIWTGPSPYGDTAE